MIKVEQKTIRFIIVGITAALVYFFCSFLLLTFTTLPPFLASLLAYASSFGFAYLGQKYWAFRSTTPHKITLSRYALLQLFCASFAAIFTQASVYYNLSPLVLSAIATILNSGISYLVSSNWVFSDSSNKQEILPNIKHKPIFHELNKRPSAFLFFTWITFCLTYIYLYYHMPWVISIRATHDDYLFVNLAYSLTEGDWLGNYSQVTLMKGPGYAFFLALTHLIGLPVYLLVAIFHSSAVSFFSWCVFSLTQSRVLLITTFISLLFLPLVISSGHVTSDHIIRDQIYPDQFLLGFSALIFALFIANSLIKRNVSAIIAGLVFAWLWLTREEGVWVLPSIGLLMIYATINNWSAKPLKSAIIRTILTTIITFLAAHFVFQSINLFYYDKFTGLDIKEKNFNMAVSGLQSIQVGENISHVPVSQQVMDRVYEVSPSFLELKPYFESAGQGWKSHGCSFYQWTCGEIAGGWFIWALRDATAFAGYYETPEKAAGFYKTLANEINNACNEGRLACKNNLLPYMPKITEKDINDIPQALVQMLNTLLFTNVSCQHIRRLSFIDGGDYALKRTLLTFLHSSDRFQRTNKKYKISGKFAMDKKTFEGIELTIRDNQGNAVPYSLTTEMTKDKKGYSAFLILTDCPKTCSLSLGISKQEVFNGEIPTKSQPIEQLQPIKVGGFRIIFEKVELTKGLTPVYNTGERITHRVRQALTGAFKVIIPILMLLGALAFFVVTFITIKKKEVTMLYIINCSVWLAVVTRLTVLFLVHISAFPALNVLYSMPVYSLIIIGCILSIFQYLRTVQVTSPTTHK